MSTRETEDRIVQLMRETFFSTGATGPASVDVDAEMLGRSTEELMPPVAKMREIVRDHDVSARRQIAQLFVDGARAISGIRDVRVILEPELIVTVVTEGDDLARDLELHALFVTAARDVDPAVGELRVTSDDADRVGESFL
jgi:hypothetical protein